MSLTPSLDEKVNLFIELKVFESKAYLINWLSAILAYVRYDPHKPRISMIHRAASGVRPRRLASVVPTPKLARQNHRLKDSCIRPASTDSVKDIEGDNDIHEPADSISPPLRRTLLGIHVDIPDLLSLDFSQHPSAFFHTNEARIIVVCFLSHLLG